MTPYESGTLQLQKTGLQLQEAALKLQEAALWLQELSIWTTVGVGLLHALLICAGLWMMHRASSDRNRAMDAQDRASQRRHDESMEAIDRQHKETMEALAAQRRALEALIERTAPRAAPAG